MTDEVQTPPPLQVVDSTAKEQGGAAVRDIALVLAAVPALLAFLGKRDFIGMVTWLSSVEGLPALGVVVTAAVLIWRQLVTRWSKRKLITTAMSADDRVAVVVQK
jgi:hypothetical protein